MIGRDGIPRDFPLVNHVGYGLDEKAAQTVQSWRFRLATKNGKPGAVQARVQVNFKLL